METLHQSQPFELEVNAHSPRHIDSIETLVAPQPKPPTPASIDGNGLPVKPLWRIWILDILCITAGLAAFITIIVVLALFNQKQLPNWPLKISLNTLLAFLAIVAKAAFMVPVSPAISQTQWSWFSRERPLHNFHLLDQASRGPLGSIKLALRDRHKHFVTLGAILTVVSVVTSPVTQLTISYPVRQAQHHGEAHVTGLRQLVHTIDDAAFASSNGVVQSMMPNDKNGSIVPTIPPSAVCSTGNCTFDEYSSLGVCTKMANVSLHLLVESFDIPDKEHMALLNMTLVGEIPCRMAAVMGILNGRQTYAFGDEPNLIQARLGSFVLVYTATSIQNETARAVILNNSDPLDKTIVDVFRDIYHEAVEVIFYMCVQTFRTVVDRGSERTEMVSSLVEPVNGKDSPGAYLYRNCDFILQPRAGNGYMCHEEGKDWGKALTQESYVDITWGWITFLGVELLLAGVFLALTITTQIRTRRSSDTISAGIMFQNYKDVAMAPLLALSSECRIAAGGGLGPRDKMEKTAKRLLVKFEGNEVVVARTLEKKDV
ncbi:hypothetical protein QBC38DRAFT_504783 [Podospora fimiseda]|uniref:Uncharacterized protein n=1 Tax=Podospora fimiseda TaxID=252190 RepID=A0AAN7BF43_9PEZI|nr:hypothetical protein QBC38DRAFT_504783 [Podospora fimiseda]